MAKTAGRRTAQDQERTTRRTLKRRRSACGSTAKNFHSLRSRSRFNMALSPTCVATPANAASVVAAIDASRERPAMRAGQGPVAGLTSAHCQAGPSLGGSQRTRPTRCGSARPKRPALRAVGRVLLDPGSDPQSADIRVKPRSRPLRFSLWRLGTSAECRTAMARRRRPRDCLNRQAAVPAHGHSRRGTPNGGVSAATAGV